MRHDEPSLTDVAGNRIVPRTLLEETIVSASESVIRLTFPSTPWKRFQVEIDDWAATTDGAVGQCKFGIGSVTQEVAGEYNHVTTGMPAQTLGLIPTGSILLGLIQLTEPDVNVRFGSGAKEAYSFSLTVDPGNATDSFPKVWGTGMGLSDAGTSVGIITHGMYKGATTGRAEYIEFSLSLSSTMRRGSFRLYGTE